MKKVIIEQSPSPLIKRKSQSDKDRSDLNEDKTTGLLGFLRSKDPKGDVSPLPCPTTPDARYPVFFLVRYFLPFI